jgi:hypothetical protein
MLGNAELAQGHAQLHRRAHAAKGAGRIANDGRGAKEILLEEMIEQIFRAGGMP